MSPRCILVVEDRPQIALELAPEFRNVLCRLSSATSEIAVEQARNSRPDLVLLDLDLEFCDSLAVLKTLRTTLPGSAIIALANGADPHRIALAIRYGAQDCYSKHAGASALGASIAPYLGGDPDDQSDAASAEPPVEELGSDALFVAASPVMRRLRLELRRVAHVDTPVLCLGESGTGKEVVARLIHAWSPRSKQKFLKVNCAALPSELLESELFGYQKGAFTGATHSKPGRVELCNGGTILLDEIGEMPPGLQAKLLHFLQDHEFTRLGGCTKIRVDVRVLAATNVDIKQALQAKQFREDLYYRLSTFVLRVPPLRERTEDMPILLREFLRQYAAHFGLPEPQLCDSVVDELRGYRWPGNVRELQSFAKRYLVLGKDAFSCLDGDSAKALPPISATPGEPLSGDLKSRLRTVRDDTERTAIASALEKAHWNRREAARTLNISYKSMLGKIRQYGLDLPSPQPVSLPEPREIADATCAVAHQPVVAIGAAAACGNGIHVETVCPK